MGHAVDYELAGMVTLQNCGQRLDIQAETSDNWPSLGVNIETGSF